MSATAERVLSLGRAARDAFARGDVEEGAALVMARGEALAAVTSLEIGLGNMARLQSEDAELQRAAEAARDTLGAELRRVARPRTYPVAG